MKTVITLFILTLLVHPLVIADGLSLPEVCTQQCVSDFGEVVGTAPSGVTAYSNCNNQCVNPEANFVEGIFTGIKWQCVEYARRWLLLNEKVVYGDVDIAADIWNLQTVHTPAKDQQYTFSSIVNGSTNANLQRGDLLIYASAFLGTGHVAVVLSVDEKQQKIVVGEQNYTNKIWQQESAREISYILNDERLWLLDSYLIGWKRVIK
jgi:glutathionylspermidine amidase/synthetase